MDRRRIRNFLDIVKINKIMRKYFSKYTLEMVKEDEKEYNGQILNSECAYQKFLEVFRLDKKAEEHLVMFGLNTRNDIIAAFLIAKGTINSASVNVVDIIKRIIICNCKKIIMAHNHPSGNLKPSEEDINMTNKLKEVCDLMGINFIDHLIIADDCYQSIIDN